MIKYKMVCKNCSDNFESWFASSKEFEKLKKSKLLNCLNCNSCKIEKSLMAPSIINKQNKNNIDSKNFLEIKNKLKKYKKFIKNNLDLIKIDGVSFNILKNEWMISKDESVNYITQFKKN